MHADERVRERPLAVSFLGATKFVLVVETRGPFGFGRLLRSALLLERHRDNVELFEKSRHHVAGQMLSQRLGDFARRKSRRTLLEGIIGNELHFAGLGLVSIDDGLRDLRQLHQHRFDFRQFDAIAPNLDLRIDAAVKFDLVDRR